MIRRWVLSLNDQCPWTSSSWTAFFRKFAVGKDGCHHACIGFIRGETNALLKTYKSAIAPDICEMFVLELFIARLKSGVSHGVAKACFMFEARMIYWFLPNASSGSWIRCLKRYEAMNVISIVLLSSLAIHMSRCERDCYGKVISRGLVLELLRILNINDFAMGNSYVEVSKGLLWEIHISGAWSGINKDFE